MFNSYCIEMPGDNEDIRYKDQANEVLQKLTDGRPGRGITIAIKLGKQITSHGAFSKSGARISFPV